MKQRLRYVDPAIGQGHGVIQNHRRIRILASESGGLRERFDENRHDEDDPKQHRNVSHAFNVDRHQPRDEPVPGQPENADHDSQYRGENAPQTGDQQGVQQPYECRSQMRGSGGVLYQYLVDVVACRLAEEREIYAFSKRCEVLGRIRNQPCNQQHEPHQSYDLNGYGPVARVVQQHADLEGLRLVHGGSHVESVTR